MLKDVTKIRRENADDSENTLLKEVVEIRKNSPDLDESEESNGFKKNYYNVDADVFSTDNAYAILDIEQLKALRSSFADVIRQFIIKAGWNQKTAANILEIDQPKISQIMNLRTEGFSLERLMKFFILLGWRIDIKLTK